MNKRQRSSSHRSAATSSSSSNNSSSFPASAAHSHGVQPNFRSTTTTAHTQQRWGRSTSGGHSLSHRSNATTNPPASEPRASFQQQTATSVGRSQSQQQHQQQLLHQPHQERRPVSTDENADVDEAPAQRTTIIVHEKIPFPAFSAQLQQFYKVRVNKSQREVADIIFPLQRVGLLVADLRTMDNHFLQNTLLDQSRQLASGFERSFVLLLCDKISIHKLVEVQMRLGNASAPMLIPCPNVNTAVKSVLEIAKINEVKEQVVQKHNEIALLSRSIDHIGPTILQSIPGLSKHQADVLLHGMGSIARIASPITTVEDILNETPLDSDTARKVKAFFEQDRPIL